nr:MATE family efflux transporter [Paracoccus fontiphilus]
MTHQRVLAIALPIVASNATVPLLGLVDTGVIGQLGRPEAIGAVAIGAVVLTSIYWIFGFLRMGTSGLVAQSRGAGDPAEGGAHLLRALAIAGVAGACFILLQGVVFRAAFGIAPTSAVVEGLARDYLAIRIWGAPATIALYALTGWLIAVERAKSVLLLQLVQNGLNAALSVWFVLGLDLGVPGVAAATLLSEYCGLLLGLWMTRRAMAQGLTAAGLFARAKLGRLARVNSDIMIRSVLLQASFTSFVFLGARHGDVTLAANQVLLQFLSVTAYALDGFAFAAESLVGQAVGARRPGGVRKASVLTSVWGIGGAAVLALAFWLGGGAVIDLLTTSPEVRVEARRYLPWLGLAPLVGVAAWMLDGIFIGATLTRDMRLAMIWSALVFLAAVLLLPPVWGNHGLWASLMALNLSRGITMALRYPRAEAAAA